MKRVRVDNDDDETIEIPKKTSTNVTKTNMAAAFRTYAPELIQKFNTKFSLFIQVYEHVTSLYPENSTSEPTISSVDGPKYKDAEVWCNWLIRVKNVVENSKLANHRRPTLLSIYGTSDIPSGDDGTCDW